MFSHKAKINRAASCLRRAELRVFPSLNGGGGDESGITMVTSAAQLTLEFERPSPRQSDPDGLSDRSSSVRLEQQKTLCFSDTVKTLIGCF